MTTSYPGALDSFTNPTSTDALNSSTVPHATQHANLNDAVLAIETELGISPKGSAATVKARLDAINPAAGQVQGTSRIFAGASALSQTAIATNPMVIAKDAGATYVQVAAANSSSTGSADFAAYGDNGTDAAGWVDMGFTGSGFNDTNYTITGKNDGYVFAQGVDAAGLSGNLVLATGAKGTNGTADIVFATGGFLTANEKARLLNSTGQLRVNGLLTQAGTASLAPVVMTSGTNLTTPAAGAVEYDGTAGYFTPSTTAGRGALQTAIYATNGIYAAPLLSATTAQPLFGGFTSATGTLGTPTGTGPWTVVITGMSSTGGFIPGKTITATAGTGTFNTNTVTVVSVDSATQITVSATGGTIPTAGTVTNVKVSTTGALSLPASTIYMFEAFIALNTGTTSHTLNFGFGGTATFTAVMFETVLNDVISGGNAATTARSAWFSAATGGVLYSTGSTAASKSFWAKGMLRTNAAGTIIPQLTFGTAPGGTNSVALGSYIKFNPIGTGSIYNSGAWA